MENKQVNEKRQFLGIWIPREIYLNNDLSWTDKILLVEIESLDNERGCFASNDYFAEFLGCTKTTISTSISKLKKLGFVKQVSFDGRTRILKAEIKEFESQTLKKSKGRQTENLTHNKTKNSPKNNPIKKELKINNKNFDNSKKEDPKPTHQKLTDDPKLNQKVNSMLNGAVFINVEDLKNEQLWIEHCSRYLKLSPHFTDQLLKQFIDEQKLKDDDFKSLKETKSHFLNWAKIEVAKNRKFGNDSWGRYTPQHVQPKKPQKEFKPKELSKKEKKELHDRFINDHLIVPYNNFVKNGSLRIENFGGIVFKELQKLDLLIKDKTIIEEIKIQIENSEEENKKGGKFRRSLQQQMGIKPKRSNMELELIKRTLEKMKKNKVKLEEIIK